MGQTSSSTSTSASPSSLSSDHPPPEYGYHHGAPPSHGALVPVPPSHGGGGGGGGEVEAPAQSDGYRWRKYGQKSVKGSAYARNYYKCTFPGCTVKKQVDKINSNGKIIDQVLCKGEHSHGPPQIIRINAHDQQSFKNSVINESTPHTENRPKRDDPPHDNKRQYSAPSSSSSSSHQEHPSQFPLQLNYHSPQHPPRQDLRTHTESTNTGMNSHPSSLPRPISPSHPDDGDNSPVESPDPHAPSNSSNNNTALVLSPSSSSSSSMALVSISSPPPPSHPAPPVTSPRLVIETSASVDCLDDGYHWRKYGQKTVKGSPFPRSYYKCTERGCPVKKQVEQNGDHIVNTYEGTHTHLAPAMDDSDMNKKRRLRRSEGQDAPAPKRAAMIKPESGDGDSKPGDILNRSSEHHAPLHHTPMPIGSMGSILHHTSHLHSSMGYLGVPPMSTLIAHATASASNPPDLIPFPSPSSSVPPSSTSSSSIPSQSSKLPSESTPALAPLHSFSFSSSPSPSQPSYSQSNQFTFQQHNLPALHSTQHAPSHITSNKPPPPP